MPNFNNEIRKLKCISSLEDDYFSSFSSIVTHYSDYSNSGLLNQDGAFYTLHDFSHHCYNIYKNISNILLNDYAFSPNGLSSEELFVLDISVLFHDISMYKIPDFNRNNHSHASAIYFNELWGSFESGGEAFFRKYIKMEQKKAISLIIKAHSDIKDKDNKVIEDTLKPTSSS